MVSTKKWVLTDKYRAALPEVPVFDSFAEASTYRNAKYSRADRPYLIRSDYVKALSTTNSYQEKSG